MKKYIYFLIIGLVACKPDISPKPDTVEEKSIIKISNIENVLEVDEKIVLMADLIKGSDTTKNVVGFWTSSDISVGEILENNKLLINEEGLFTIYVSYEGLTDSLIINAVNKESEAKKIEVKVDNSEIAVNGEVNFTVKVLDDNDNELPLENTQWNVNDDEIVSIDSNGTLSAKAGGTAIVWVESNGLTSENVNVSVFKSGTFSGKEGHSASGGVRLLYRNGQLILEMQSDFNVQGGPDLRVFLSNIENGSRVNAEALELSLLKSNSGKQTYVVPENVSISDYQYVNVHCKQYNTTFGSAKFN